MFILESRWIWTFLFFYCHLLNILFFVFWETVPRYMLYFQCYLCVMFILYISYSINIRCWTGNVAATKWNGCFGELAQVTSAHTVLTIANVSHQLWETLHWFAPQLHFTSFCTENSHLYKLLFYQRFSIIFKGEDCIWNKIVAQTWQPWLWS